MSLIVLKSFSLWERLYFFFRVCTVCVCSVLLLQDDCENRAESLVTRRHTDTKRNTLRHPVFLFLQQEFLSLSVRLRVFLSFFLCLCVCGSLSFFLRSAGLSFFFLVVLSFSVCGALSFFLSFFLSYHLLPAHPKRPCTSIGPIPPLSYPRRSLERPRWFFWPQWKRDLRSCNHHWWRVSHISGRTSLTHL